MTFQAGLRDNIQLQVSSLGIRSFAELVEKCQRGDDCCKRMAISRNAMSNLPPRNFDRNLAPQGCNFKSNNQLYHNFSHGGGSQNCPNNGGNGNQRQNNALRFPQGQQGRACQRAPIDVRFAAARSSCRPLHIHPTCKTWYILELSGRCPQAWVSPEMWRIGGWNRWLSMRTTIDCAWMLDGATKDHVYTLSLASRFLSRRNRFEGYRVDSLGLNTSKSSNFITSEPIQCIIEPIRFSTELKV
ncbi:hypothetical protein PIB30_035323 [Stylosanthes scabra]|uniref:Uncharacterized protein n=1 Tax=Stylosanthes scabra TaxID=79078 RepID=A0ABU6SCY0_9FABA|nr:hypothetical protein [Stylosanthes scabra]